MRVLSIVVVGYALIVGVNIAWTAIRNWDDDNFHNRAIRISDGAKSHQKANKMLFDSLLFDYRRQKTLEGKDVLVDQIRSFAATVPPEQVPGEVRDIIGSGGKGTRLSVGL